MKNDYNKHENISTKNSDLKSENSVFYLIIENERYCETVRYNLDEIHCNGCGNRCPLSHPGCDRGVKVSEKIKGYQEGK